MSRFDRVAVLESRVGRTSERCKMSESRKIRAARGSTISCKGWHQEAALRMLMNNLDPEVAERPDELIVYGGTGRAARDWPSLDRKSVV